MTPIEIHEYKQKWMPGYSVPVHSDHEHRCIDWCNKQLEKHQWKIRKWSDIYEHTFHFESIIAGQNFEMEMNPLNPPERSIQ